MLNCQLRDIFRIEKIYIRDNEYSQLGWNTTFMHSYRLLQTLLSWQVSNQKIFTTTADFYRRGSTFTFFDHSWQKNPSHTDKGDIHKTRSFNFSQYHLGKHFRNHDFYHYYTFIFAVITFLDKNHVFSLYLSFYPQNKL